MEQPTTSSSPSRQPSSPSEWTAEQQRSLDEALKKYPATMDKKQRWLSIASDVDGKSLNDCIDRFKYLCSLVKSGHVMQLPSNAAPPAPASVASTAMPNGTASSKSVKTEQKTKQEDVEQDAEAEEEEEDTTVQAVNSKITPEARRVPIETEPAHRGTQLSLADLFLYQVGTLVMHRLVCQVQCTNCPLKFDAALTLDESAAGVPQVVSALQRAARCSFAPSVCA
ncbi:hypothetical protein PINS_up000256 [Pythium insidiosum]|nr:hypothetical protein PINS_up000256 [Pythium insidiosum]